MNPIIKTPWGTRLIKESDSVNTLGPNECAFLNIPDGQYSRSKPTELGGELPSYGGAGRILGGMGRFYAEKIDDTNPTMDLSIDWDEFNIRHAPARKKFLTKAACAKTTKQTLDWTRSLLERLTETEMDLSAAKFNVANKHLKIKGAK